MAFSYTGLAFLLGSFSIGLLAYRFFQYWQEGKNTTSKLFFWFAAIFAFFMFFVAIAGLFFAGNNQILRLIAIVAALAQAVACAIGGYLIIYIKFPSVSPWIGFIAIFLLGLLATFSAIFIPFYPYLESSGGINWNIPLFVGVVRSLVFVIVFLPLISILIRQARSSKDALLRSKAFGLSLLMVFSIVLGFLDFFLGTVLGLPAVSSAITLIFLSIVVFFLVFVTQKSPKKQKKEFLSSPPSSQIQW